MFTIFLILDLVIVISATILCFIVAYKHNKKINRDTLEIDIDSKSQVVHMKEFMKTEVFKHIMQL